ncbi:MAG TPA: hypothetical protein VGB79_08890, partial [Allosphingosinicella sp.]
SRLDRRSRDLAELSLAWFGGEPLAALDIVLDVSDHARRLAAARGFRFASSATTNGWILTPANMRALVAAGVTAFQVTLDGEKEVHDQTRVRGGGGGTFDRIYGNLLALRASSEPFEILLRVHISRKSEATIVRFFGRLADDFGGDDRFSLFVKGIEDLGGDGARDLVPLQNQESIHQAAARLFPRIDGGGDGEVQVPICYASKLNALVVRADGRLGKCTVALEDPRNTVGSLRPDGTLEIDGAKVRPWAHGLFSGDADALRCPLASLPSALAAAPS